MRKKLGEMLRESSAISEEQLREALAVQKQRSVLLGEQLIVQGACGEDVVYRALAKQASMPYVNLEKSTPAEHITSLLAKQAAYELTSLPVAEKDDALLVAISDPRQAVAVDTLNFLLEREIRLVIASPSHLRAALERVYGPDESSPAQQPLRSGGQHDEAPIVRLVNRMFADAVKQRASDIHIEPFADRVRIRFRIDGKLVIADEHPTEVFAPLISHIKVSGGLDIAEKRRPQDGRIEHTVDGHELDVRVSVLPTNNGQTCVMRLLDREANLISLADLGMNEESLEWFSRLIERPSGIFLVTGPTGSGKTTTLYAALQTLNRPDKKILTVEDPVEYFIDGINQTQINNKVKMSFAKGLRAILRQDPDVVMLGEVRDSETAQIAVQASLTGHLVFSTLHTNTAVGAISRLRDMGIEPFLLSSSLSAVLAQRLIRTLCSECKESHSTDRKENEKLGTNEPSVIYQSKGCDHCNQTGYMGRSALYELLSINDDIKELIYNEASEAQILESAKSHSTLREQARQMVLAGDTSLYEAIRVVSL